MSDFEDVTLPFSDTKQSAILGHIISNTNGFCLQAINRIKPNWFKGGHNAKIFGYVANFYRDRKTPPTKEEIVSCPEFRGEDAQMRKTLKASMLQAVQASEEIRLEVIKDELTVWMQAKLLQNALSESAQYWNKKDFKRSAARVETLVKEYYDAKFDDNEQVNFNDPENYLAELERSRENCISTGLPILDEYIMSNHKSGSLQAGATTVVLASSNSGKSAWLITTAIHNIKAGKSVLFMTHEDRFEDVRVRMLQSYLGMDINTLLSEYKTPEGLKAIKDATKDISAHLVYVPVNKPGMTVEDVVPAINRAQDRHKMEHDGKGYDLFINDYPGKLSTMLANNLQYRHVQDQVYDAFVQMALQHRWHSIVAMQVNRNGSKINKGQKGVEERLLTMEDAAEAWGPMTTATTVLTLNRSPDAMAKGHMSILVAKSRTSQAGMAVLCKTDFAKCITHSEELGGWAYGGGGVLDDIADSIIKTSGKNVIDPVSPTMIYNIKNSLQP